MLILPNGGWIITKNTGERETYKPDGTLIPPAATPTPPATPALKNTSRTSVTVKAGTPHQMGLTCEGGSGNKHWEMLGSPDWASVEDFGALALNPPRRTHPGDYVVTIRVSDDSGYADGHVTVKVTAPPKEEHDKDRGHDRWWNHVDEFFGLKEPERH